MKNLSKSDCLNFLPAVFLVLLTGCLSRPSLERQNFALHPDITPAAAQSAGILAVRSCEVSPLFGGRSFVYRFDSNVYETDPYAGFLVPPSQALAIPLRAAFRDSGAFRDVVEPGSSLRPDTLVEVNVTELYGDFRKREQPLAVLSVRMVFMNATNRDSGQAFLQKTYSRKVAISKNSAAALVAGWNQALKEIMSEAATDLESTRRQVASHP